MASYKRDVQMDLSKMENDLIFEPVPGVSFTVRTDVPKLKTTYGIYRRALWLLVNDWLVGDVGIGAPTEKWEQEAIRIINDSVNKPDEDDIETTDRKENISKVYDNLISINVPIHLKTATSHRKWIRQTHGFLVIIGVELSEKMLQLTKKHDLSKYTHRDVLGYAIMFGDGQNDWKKLEEDEDKNEWQNTLDNHYAANPHHPEYFYRKLADGTRDKSRSMNELDPDDGKTYLDESVIDMLAARGERILKEDKVISVTKWMDIQDIYLTRYGEVDKQYVKEKLDEWMNLALRFLANKENHQKIKGHFDVREIVE